MDFKFIYIKETLGKLLSFLDLSPRPIMINSCRNGIFMHNFSLAHQIIDIKINKLPSTLDVLLLLYFSSFSRNSSTRLVREISVV